MKQTGKFAHGAQRKSLENITRQKPPIIEKPVDPNTVRPTEGKAFIRVEWVAFRKSAGGIFMPSEKTGRKVDLGRIFSKEEYRFVTLLRLASDAATQRLGLEIGGRYVLPTHREPRARAIHNTVFNYIPTSTGGEYDIFVWADALIAAVES